MICVPLTTSFVVPQSLSRKSFLKLGALTLGSMSIPLAFVRSPQRGTSEGCSYSASFLAFCQQARFESISHALHSVRDQELEFSLEYCDT